MPRAATAADLPGGGEAPGEVLLLPAGEIPTRPHDQRAAWRNPDAEAVVAATRGLGLDLAIDYDHQGERSRDNGQPAPAAGWITRVFARAGAVWGAVEWTARAAAMIAAREYRFISPLFEYDARTRVVQRVVGAGLTNDPAFYMRAIARAQPTESDEMDLAALRQALGLPEDAAGKDILTAATASAGAAAALKRVAAAAGLSADAAASEIETAVSVSRQTAAAGAGDPDPARFVPRAEFERVSERLQAVERARAEERATAAVDAAVSAGKVAPAQRGWALGYAGSDAAGFQAYVDAAPVIVQAGARRMPSASGDGARAPFRGPAGRAVDEERLALHGRALARAAKDGIDYAAAAALEEEAAR